MNDIKKIYDFLKENNLKDENVLETITHIIYYHSNKDIIKATKPTCFLITGASGSGKTRLAKLIAQYLNKYMITIDAKSLSEVGYSGNNINSIFENLYLLTQGNIKLAENSIVHIDEFDKLEYVATNTRDISGLGVQQSLLKVLDGISVELDNITMSRALNSNKILLNTNNIMFILSGSFNNKKIGTPKHLLKLGFIKEIINRIDSICYINKVSYKDLCGYLDDISFFTEIVNYAKDLNIEISFHKSFIDKFIKTIYDNEFNYRVLYYYSQNIIYKKIISLSINNVKKYNFTEKDIIID